MTQRSASCSEQERASFEKQWAAVEHWTLLALPK